MSQNSFIGYGGLLKAFGHRLLTKLSEKRNVKARLERNIYRLRTILITNHKNYCHAGNNFIQEVVCVITADVYA
jgi:hypothetical protein